MTREERKKAIEVLDDMKVKIDIPKAAKTQNDRNWALDVAIKALEQEPSEDAISREDARMSLTCEIKENMTITDYISMVDRRLRKLPSVQPSRKGHWIPVSERLPEDAYGCLVTVYDTDLRTQDEFENILPYTVGYDGETWNNFCGEPIPFEVVAWMKLSEPYKDMRGDTE